jgi:spermidine synthase
VAALSLQIFIAGLLSIVVQVILLRELSAAFYGVDLIYLLALGAWLLWTAAGALAGRGSLRPSAFGVAALLVATGIVVPLDIALIRRLRLLLGGVPGAYLPLPAQIAASALCLLVPSVLLGLLFQSTAKRYLSPPSGDRGSGIGDHGDVPRPTPDSGPRTPDSGRSLARAYAIESLGGVVGGLATTWTLQLGVQNLELALATAALTFVAAALTRHTDRGARLQPCDPPLRRRAAGAVRAVALVFLLACLLGGWNAHRLDLWMTSWNHPDVVDASDTPYGRVTVTERAGQVSAYENDALSLESEGTEPEDFAHLSLLQHPSPQRVLLVSGASAGLLAAVAQHGPERIDDVELNQALVGLLARRLPASFKASLSLPAVHLTFDDPRRAIADCPRGPADVRPSTSSGRTEPKPCSDRYDVIVVAAAEPASAQANRFFTREFFEQCAARLKPGGLVSFRLTSIENLWTPPLIARTGSIYAALRQVFTDVVVLPGATNFVLASRARLTRDPDVLSARLVGRGIRARMVTPRYLRYLYSNDRYAEIEALLARCRARPNTDANAASYQATSLLWLSKFVPSLGQADFTRVSDAFGWSRVQSWLLLAVVAGCALAWRLGGWPRRSVLVAAAAFGGMTLETLLLVHYQLKHGVVFQDLGLLLMSVMAGLAAGAMIVDRQARLKPRPADARLFLAAFIVLALLASISIRTGWGSGLVPIGVMLFATGVIVAGVFACASLRDNVDQRRLVSPLYAADLLGGCVGSIAASLVLVPLLGLPLTAEWAAALMAVAVLLV